MLPLEFVVFGTPISAQGATEAKNSWKERVKVAAREAAEVDASAPVDLVVLRVAYFYVDAPAADLDNVIKPIQDALKGIAFGDDIQVVDLVGSMRPKAGNDVVEMSSTLATGFAGNSDFVHVVVEYSSRIEVFR